METGCPPIYPPAGSASDPPSSAGSSLAVHLTTGRPLRRCRSGGSQQPCHDPDQIDAGTCRLSATAEK
jgi:hypothetical protein